MEACSFHNPTTFLGSSRLLESNELKNKILIGGVCFSFGVSVGIISVLLLK